MRIKKKRVFFSAGSWASNVLATLQRHQKEVTNSNWRWRTFSSRLFIMHRPEGELNEFSLVFAWLFLWRAKRAAKRGRIIPTASGRDLESDHERNLQVVSLDSVTKRKKRLKLHPEQVMTNGWSCYSTCAKVRPAGLMQVQHEVFPF